MFQFAKLNLRLYSLCLVLYVLYLSVEFTREEVMETKEVSKHMVVLFIILVQALLNMLILQNQSKYESTTQNLVKGARILKLESGLTESQAVLN